MLTFRYNNLVILVLLACLISCCAEKEKEQTVSAEEVKIREVHSDYVESWLADDAEKIMGLLIEDARIQPNRLPPIEGKTEIEKFWFPNDSSSTVINAYETEILHIDVMDTLAVSTHKSMLDWTYQKDTIQFGMLQKGINTTLYRRQTDNSWKIWRSMWTDYHAERK